MANLELKYYPAEVLRQKAKKISRIDSSIRKLAQDMLDTMYANNGVGLAAPQVGVSKQIMVIDTSGEDEPPKPTIFINPELLEADGELIGSEGCLSFPNVFFEVKRFNSIVVKYQNLSGKTIKLKASGDLLCRAIQHELDHLNGELYIDKAVSKLAADIELSKHGFMGQNADVPTAIQIGSKESVPSGQKQLIG